MVGTTRQPSMQRWTKGRSSSAFPSLSARDAGVCVCGGGCLRKQSPTCTLTMRGPDHYLALTRRWAKQFNREKEQWVMWAVIKVMAAKTKWRGLQFLVPFPLFQNSWNIDQCECVTTSIYLFLSSIQSDLCTCWFTGVRPALVAELLRNWSLKDRWNVFL